MSAEILPVALWSTVTLAAYFGARKLHRHHRRWWTSPMLVAWIACGTVIVASRTEYQDYRSSTQWMITMLGPATVAFALPIHEQRALVRKHWSLLAVAVTAGCLIAFGTSWALAWLLDLAPEVRASLLPRSVSTPFAMETSRRLGGIPELTASFTAVTGLFGAAVGDILLDRLKPGSSFSRGALLGMGAHGAGVARAQELGQEEGAVAGLVMVFAGLINVTGAALMTSLG